MTGARVRHGRNGHDGPPAHVTGRSAASGFPVLARDCDGVGDSRAASGEFGSPLMAVRPSNARGKSSPSSCPPRPRRRPVASQPSQAQPSPSRSRPLQPRTRPGTHPRPHTRNNPGTPTHTHTRRGSDPHPHDAIHARERPPCLGFHVPLTAPCRTIFHTVKATVVRNVPVGHLRRGVPSTLLLGRSDPEFSDTAERTTRQFLTTLGRDRRRDTK